MSNPPDTIVLKVPSTWERLDPAVVAPEAAKTKAISWLQFYSGGPVANPALYVSGVPTQPFLVLQTFTVSEQEITSLTLDQLRDANHPITAAAQENAAAEAKASGLAPVKVEVMLDNSVTSPVGSGIHVRYAADEGQGPVVYDQTAVIDKKRKELHFVILKCAWACYRIHAQEFGDVIDSLTLKRP